MLNGRLAASSHAEMHEHVHAAGADPVACCADQWFLLVLSARQCPARRPAANGPGRVVAARGRRRTGGPAAPRGRCTAKRHRGGEDGYGYAPPSCSGRWGWIDGSCGRSQVQASFMCTGTKGPCTARCAVGCSSRTPTLHVAYAQCSACMAESEPCR
jgi:hypothetical protein